MGSEKIGGVAETMLQTLYARAKESKKPHHKIYDEKAIEIVEWITEKSVGITLISRSRWRCGRNISKRMSA